MESYPKIDTVYLRDPETGYKTLLRGQYSSPEFAYLADNEWVFTEKVDGTNIRVMISKDGDIAFGGRTDKASIPAPLLGRLRERFAHGREFLAKAFPEGACLYGEGYGARIQGGGGNYRADQDFVLFDVKVGRWWLQRDSVEDISERLAIDVVPIVGRGTLSDMVRLAERGVKSRWGNLLAEGIVARPACEMLGRDGRRIIAKVKTRDFAAEGSGN